MGNNATIFPAPVVINGRMMFDRLALENHKRRLIGLPPLDRNPSAPIELVPAGQVAREFGVSRRTIGRRVAAAEAA